MKFINLAASIFCGCVVLTNLHDVDWMVVINFIGFMLNFAIFILLAIQDNK